MDINSISNAVSSSGNYATKTSTKSATSSSSSGFSDTAAVYESSQNTSTSSATSYRFSSVTDRSAIIAQMKADQETRMNQLTDIVNQTLQKQGSVLGTSDSIWHFLASGNLKNVDEAAVAQAKEDISDTGYWGADKTSSRIVDFAIALSGNDTSKAEDMINAFKKGYAQATQSWGQTLPDLSKKTYDAVMDKFSQWKNGTYTSTADTKTTDTDTQ